MVLMAFVTSASFYVLGHSTESLSEVEIEPRLVARFL